MASGKYKDLAKRTESDKVFRAEAFKIASNPKYDGIKEDQLQWYSDFLIRSQKRSGVTMLANKFSIKSMLHQQLLSELHKPIN